MKTFSVLLVLVAVFSAGCDAIVAQFEETVYVTISNDGEVPFITFQRGEGNELVEAIPVLYPGDVAVAECQQALFTIRNECVLVASALGPTYYGDRTEEARFRIPREGIRDISWEVRFRAPREEDY